VKERDEEMMHGLPMGVHRNEAYRSPIEQSGTRRARKKPSDRARNPEGCQPLAGGCRAATTPGLDTRPRMHPGGVLHGCCGHPPDAYVSSHSSSTKIVPRISPMMRRCFNIDGEYTGVPEKKGEMESQKERHLQVETDELN